MNANEQRRQALLKALEENEDDTVSRMIYADLLDENGEAEEADRQRRWPEAKAWMVEFARRWNFFDATHSYPGGHWDDEKEEWVEDYSGANPNAWRELVKAAQHEDYVVAHGIDLHHVSELEGDDVLFWQHMETLTGKRFDKAHKDNFSWSCSC